MPTLKIPVGSLGDVPSILTGQLAVQAVKGGVRIDATGLQIPGVLDDLYATDTDLGVVWDGGAPTITLWAPTAKNVTLHVFDDADPSTISTTFPMTASPTGVWSAIGDASWNGKYYLFEVEVYVPSTGAVETNLVTDPYSVSLSMNSTRSQIVDLSDPALAPAGWDDARQARPGATRGHLDLRAARPRLLDLRRDASRPANGARSRRSPTTSRTGWQHLAELADAGLSHVHLLPVFDIATIEEDASLRQEPDPAVLATYAPDSDQQQAAVSRDGRPRRLQLGLRPVPLHDPRGLVLHRPERTDAHRRVPRDGRSRSTTPACGS